MHQTYCLGGTLRPAQHGWDLSICVYRFQRVQIGCTPVNGLLVQHVPHFLSFHVRSFDRLQSLTPD